MDKPHIASSTSHEPKKTPTATSGGASFPALQQLAAGLSTGLPDLAAAICHCIDIKTSALLDRASPRLGQLRLKRRENKRRLQEEMDGFAQCLHQQGACESRQVCCPSCPDLKFCRRTCCFAPACIPELSHSRTRTFPKPSSMCQPCTVPCHSPHSCCSTHDRSSAKMGALPTRIPCQHLSNPI